MVKSDHHQHHHSCDHPDRSAYAEEEDQIGHHGHDAGERGQEDQHHAGREVHGRQARHGCEDHGDHGG